ncbi:MAG: hypothetical protein NC332_05375, partial [Firmicutes bacterium]|nr:hypothetical protein [Bacillota bacterium]
MITAKFGGTAVTPRNLAYIKNCLTPFHKCVVVSAVGKEYPSDEKTTDLLARYYVEEDEKAWSAVEDKYRRLVLVNAVNTDVDKILYDAKRRARKFSLQYCMSLGEEISAKITAEFLDAAYVEAEQTVRFNSRGLSFKETVKSLKSAFKGVDLAVTGGYYGGYELSRRTFPRGGSDITGALCAVACESSLYENWTDVNGVCVADPVKVSGAATIPALSFYEMRRLSECGAEVLHPHAIAPVEQAGIPIKIGNYFNPDGPSTVVSNCRSRNEILSLTEKKEANYTVTTLLHGMPLHKVTRIISEFLRDNVYNFDCFG